MKIRLLLVEDDPQEIELALFQFEKHPGKYDVMTAQDGLEALEKLRSAQRENRLPAAILLDLKMRRMNGLEFLQRIRREPELNRIPIAVLTSSADERDRAESFRLGARLFLQKPLSLDDFDDVLREVDKILTV